MLMHLPRLKTPVSACASAAGAAANAKHGTKNAAITANAANIFNAPNIFNAVNVFNVFDILILFLP